MTGSADGTCPSTGGAAAAPAGSASGSARVEGAVATNMSRHITTTAARRTTTVIGLTRDTLGAIRIESRNSLRNRPKSLCVRN
jgi:hypothetical protein